MKCSRRLLPLLSVLVSASTLLGASTSLSAVERGPQRAVPAASDLANAARVIVKFKSGASLLRTQAAASTTTTTAASGPQLADRLGKRLGLSLADGRVISARSQLVTGSGLDAKTLAQRLARDSDVEWAVPDQRRFAMAAPNDPLYPNGLTSTTPAVGQWYLRAPSGTVKSSIDVETAWNNGTGSGVVVAVLDTGVRTTHPDLSGQLLSGYDFISDVATANDGNGRDADPSDPGDWITTSEDASGSFRGCGASDSSWHGTQVAGLVAAATNNAIGMAGVARDAKVLPVRVLGKCGGYDSDIIDAMRWAAGFTVSGVSVNPNPARVINLSLGSAGTCTSAYVDVMNELTAAGVVVVAAAGNDGLDVGTPANCSGVIAVAGVRHVGTKVGYSDLGPSVAISAPAGNCVNETGTCLYPLLTTLDTGTRSPVSASYSDGSNSSLGTSFASPIVAGTVALMLSANSSLTPAEVTSTLKSTARAFPTTGGDSGAPVCQAPSSTAQVSECYCTTSTCGAGLLDAGAAVAAVSGWHVAFSATPASPTAGAAILLNASATTVPAGRSIASYAWQITAGSGIAAFTSGTTAATATLDTTGAGSVTVMLTVTDDSGQSNSASQTLAIGTSTLTAVIGASATSVTAGSTVSLSATGSAVASDRSIASYLWEITSGSGSASLASSSGATTTLNTSAAGSVTVRLTITDSAGLQASSSQAITVAAAAKASSGGGGGALAPGWGLALLAATLALAALQWRTRRTHAARRSANAMDS